MTTHLTRDDLWSLEQYSEERPAFRARVMAHKKTRQVALGEHARLYFEDALTIKYQIQEMLRIEKVFEAEGFEDEVVISMVCRRIAEPQLDRHTSLSASIGCR